MHIIRSEEYLLSLERIMEFIAKDNFSRALNFQSQLDNKISNLSFMPYKFKKSIYFNDKNIRDLIYKGYVIPYKINKNQNTLTIIGMNKYKREL